VEGFWGCVQAPRETISNVYRGMGGSSVSLGHVPAIPRLARAKANTSKLLLDHGQVCQVDAQVPEGPWRDRRDQSRKPSWKKGDISEDMNSGQNPDRPN
jgi:hypothetical protein